jgi:hypothetical protein
MYNFSLKSGFELVKSSETKLSTISLNYGFNDSDYPNELKELLVSLEREFGGTYAPVVRGSGGLSGDFMGPVLTISVSFIAAPLAKKYFDGLLDGDSAKDLGIKHREEIEKWLESSKEQLYSVISKTINFLKRYPNSLIYKQRQTDLEFTLVLKGKRSKIILMQNLETDRLEELPEKIDKFMTYILNNDSSQRNESIKLIFNSETGNWTIEGKKAGRY